MADTPADALMTVPFLQRASPEAVRALASQSTWRNFDRNQFLFHAGAPADRMYVLTGGRVAAVSTSSHGATVILHIAAAGEVAGCFELLDGGPHTASAKALGSVSTLMVPTAPCRTLLRTEPAVLLDFTRSLSTMARTLSAAVDDLVFLDLDRRLCRHLLDMPVVDGAITLPVTQDELAARLGVVRQSLNAAMARLKRRGLLEMPSQLSVRIIDRDALAHIVASRPATP